MIQGIHKTDYTLSDMAAHIAFALEGGHCIAYNVVNSHWFEMRYNYKYLN